MVSHTVVRATTADIPLWLALAREVEELFGSPMAEDDVFLQVLQRSIGAGRAFCVHVDGHLAGAMLGRPGLISWLAVGRHFRRRGVGSALVTEAQSWTQSQLRVTTFGPGHRHPDAALSRHLYVSLGFVAAEDSDPGTDGTPRITMVWRPTGLTSLSPTFVLTAAGTGLPLTTSRLKLIPLEEKHADELFIILQDQSLYTFTGGRPPRSLARLRARYRLWESRRSPDGSEVWLNWGLRLRTEHEASLIGRLQVGIAGTSSEIAWVLGTAWQKNGYATEAAQAVVSMLVDSGVTEVRAKIHPDHRASIRLAERLGLSRTSESVEGEVVWAKFTSRALGTAG